MREGFPRKKKALRSVSILARGIWKIVLEPEKWGGGSLAF